MTKSSTAPCQTALNFPTMAMSDMPIVVSAKSCRLRFNGCEPDFIRDVCHGRCCESSSHPSGVRITILDEESPTIAERGGMVAGGFLQPREGQRRCPFKTSAHLCGLHQTDDKPFGCISSPFTLNKNDKLIVRNRYKMLKCYNAGPQIPAYIAFRESLKLIFGNQEPELHAHLEAGGGDKTVMTSARSYLALSGAQEKHHKRNSEDMT